jgi:hypothetical protein
MPDDYVDGMLEKRGPFRAAHLAHATKWKEGAKLVNGGAWTDPCDGAVIVFSKDHTTKEEIEAEFAAKDPCT